MQQRKYIVGGEARGLFDQAIARHLPLSLTTCQEQTWQVYKTYFLAHHANRLLISMPVPDTEGCHIEPAPGQEIALTFKKGYYKHIFISRVLSREEHTHEDGSLCPALAILIPDRIERIQRRAYNRAEVPDMMRIPVHFSLLEDDNEGSDYVYEGLLQDVSAGGLGVRSSDPRINQCQAGQQFQLNFMPPIDQLPIEIFVRLRHITPPTEQAEHDLGFQVVGLEISEEGRAMLRRLGRLANRLQRQNQFS